MSDLRIEYTKADDGVSIAWTSIGEGLPIVLSSNLFGDINLYSSGGNTSVELLGDAGRKVLFYDARGAGSSERQVTDIALEARVADLKAVIDKAGAGPVALIGRFQGGLAAIAYAVRHPERLTHLVLWDTFTNGAEYYSATSYTRAIDALTGMAADDWEFFTLNLAHWASGFRDSERSLAIAKGFKAGMSAQGYLSAVEATRQIDVSALLPVISVPTLVVVDQSFVLAVPDAGRVMASAIPGAQFVSVLGPRRATDAVIQFITATSAAHQTVEGRSLGSIRTVLFTDLVGHTEMMQRLGDARGREVLREHERITRETLRAYDGTEIKTDGDSFMISFGSVTSSLECAVALQHAFADREGEPLAVRMGLNAGEPIEEDGDLFGATVILASRIAGKAGAGEILVSDNVRSLCAGKGFLFADRGEFVAKGFEEPVRVYEVNWRNDR